MKNSIIDLIWPPISLLTNQRIAISGTIEPEIWAKLPFMAGSKCYKCGVIFEESFHPESLCGTCISDPPEFDSARAVLKYNEETKPFILALKYGQRKDGVKTFASLMKQQIDFWDKIDFILPVPIHKFRLMKRGFNQSAWLAHEISNLTNIPWRPDLLKRIKNTKSQNGLSILGRKRNVSGAFWVDEKVKDKIFVLIDDVYTTGATLNACAKALKKKGAKEVHIITFLRVNRPQSNDAIEI